MAATKPSIKASKQAAVSTKKSTKSSIGAPSQHNQTSRKGKRAWRKNVDIGDVEAGLEGMRAEERVTGKILQKTKNDELFQIDVKGDDKIRKSQPRFSTSQLTSTKILAQRSAVPAVYSRPTVPTNKRKSAVSHEDKARLLRIGKRQRKGPFNSLVDPTEFGAGSAMLELSEAVKNSGSYDPWAPQPEVEEPKDGLETVQKQKIKAPILTHPRDAIDVPAIVEPHQGTSYNPPADAHQALLLKAHEMEERRIQEAEKLSEVKQKIDNARREEEEVNIAVAPGMQVDEAVPTDEDVADGETDSEELPAKKPPPRKTQSQRKKAARLLAEKRALAEKAAKKRMLAVIPSAKSLRRTNARLMFAQEKEQAERQLALQENMRQRGLAGQKLGKHKVPESKVDVQLGEELSESLRALKPEGNLFRDRFLSLQQRALIEPRVPVLPKKHRTKIVEYEKHAWKRFE